MSCDSEVTARWQRGMLMCDVCIVTSCDCHITLLVCHPSLWLMSWCHITTPSPPVVHCGTTGGATYFSLEFLSFPLQWRKKTIYAQFWVILFLRTTKVVLHLIGWPSHSAAWSLAAWYLHSYKPETEWMWFIEDHLFSSHTCYTARLASS